MQAIFGWDWRDGAQDNSNLRYSKVLANGSGHDQADAVWHDEDRELGDGGSHYLDLSGLVREVMGHEITIDFERIKGILIVNSPISDGTLLVGNADYDCWWAPFRTVDDHVEVPPDSPLMLANRKDGWPVTGSGESSSGEGGQDRMLKIAASGGAAKYDIAILGTEAAFVSSSSGT